VEPDAKNARTPGTRSDEIKLDRTGKSAFLSAQLNPKERMNLAE